MATRAPQKSDFDQAEQYNKYKDRMLLFAAIISGIAAVYGVLPYSFSFADNVFPIGVLVFTGLGKYFDCRFGGMYRKAERTRRDGFLDNTFNARLADISSEGYYDTEEIEPGMRKLISNVHENSFFSEKIVNAMFKQAEKKLLVSVVLIVIIALVNLGGTQFVIAVTNIFLLFSIWEGYFKLKELKLEVSIVQAECKDLWRNYTAKKKKPDNKTTAKILQIYLRYETALAYASIMFDTKVFNKINPSATQDWEEMKKRFKM